MDPDSLNVYILRDTAGNVQSIDHLNHPYSLKGSNVKLDAVSVSQQYIKDTASLYGIHDSYLKQLNKKLDEELPSQPLWTTAIESALLLARNPRCLHKTTVVVYQRTIYGLPVWQEGVSITLNEDLDVISSISTLRTDKDAKPLNQNAEFIKEINEEKLKKLLGLASTEPLLRINRQRLLEYRFNYKAREDKGNLANLNGPLPQLAQLEPNAFNEGRYYASMEVLFMLGDVNWKAFIEVETGAVLYLRAHVACLHGFVYTTDPLTRLGAGGPQTLDALNEAREWKELLELTPSAPQDQRLESQCIKVVHDENYNAQGTVVPIGVDGNFTHNADSQQFAAVNAYYHLESLFRLLSRLGFNIAQIFTNSQFPLPVHHYNTKIFDAEAYGNARENGLARFVFGIVTPGQTIGTACDFRLVAHEFCHALLYETIESPNFTFAHSAGDALGSIFCDPFTSLGGDARFTTFPWLNWNRRHDRPLNGWAWGGGHHDGQYESEQILNTTLFRAYRCIGGDAEQIGRKQWASRYMLYLIIAGMTSLPIYWAAPLQDATAYVTAMMQADNGRIMGFPGGAVYKVIRWSFEEQGLYQPDNENRDLMVQRGAASPVDVYINDGRQGGYGFAAEWNAAPDIWNRRAGDGAHQHQEPLQGVVNFCYVRIRNRGTQAAGTVVVSAYHRDNNRDTTWPEGFEATTTAPIHHAQNIAAGGEAIIGPFRWTPLHNSQSDSLLVAVSAQGDLSNIDPQSPRACARGSIDIDKLVPFDNNIGLRVMNVANA